MGKLPEPLDIPKRKKGETIAETVEKKLISDERLGKFVELVKAEYKKDKSDVVAIYKGDKGLPKVKDNGKVET